MKKKVNYSPYFKLFSWNSKQFKLGKNSILKILKKLLASTSLDQELFNRDPNPFRRLIAKAPANGYPNSYVLTDFPVTKKL